MANRTVNRTPSFINTSALDEKYSNFSTFKGICDNKNYLGIDQTTFEDANNMYIDQDAQLSSRPPIKQVAFVHGVIIKIYKINSLVVYHTLDDDKYYVHFKFEETWYSREVTEKINITWWDKHYVIFTETNIEGFSYDYLNETVTWYDTEATVYFPITELVSGIVSTKNEAANALTTKKIIRYLFRQGIDTPTVNIVGKNIVVDIDDEKFEITFVKNNEKVFTKAVGEFTATRMQSSDLGNFLAYTSTGNIYYSIDGSLFYPITKPEGILPFMSDDGTSLYGIKTPENASSGTIYYMPLIVTNSAQIPDLTWISYNFTIPVGENSPFNMNHWASKTRWNWEIDIRRNMSSMMFTGIKFVRRYEPFNLDIGFETYGHSPESGKAIFISSIEADVTYVNNSANGFGVSEHPTYANWGGGDGRVTGKLYGRLLILLTSDNDITFIPMFDNDATDPYSIRYANTNGKIKYCPISSSSGTSISSIFIGYYPGIFELEVVLLNNKTPFSNMEYYLQNDSIVGPYYILNKQVIWERFLPGLNTASSPTIDNFDIFAEYLILTNTQKWSFIVNGTSLMPPIRYHHSLHLFETGTNGFQIESFYNPADYTNKITYPADSTADIPNREAYPILTGSYSTYKAIADKQTSLGLFKLYNNGVLTNTYYRYDEQNIPLLVRNGNNLPMYVSNNRITYYNKTDHKIYDSTAWNEAYIDLLQDGEHKLFVPYSVGTFVTNVVSNNNKVLISSPREGKVYLPENDVLSFSNEITNLVTFNQTSLGIFSENEVHELQYDEGMYRLSLTKLQLGCKKDSDVLLNYDGKTIFLTTLKGLNALNYQDFVQSTEYVYNYLTENIMSMYDTYAKSPLKLYQFKNWVFMYRQDVNYLFLFDLRNASWWKWTNIANVQQIIFDNEDLILLINGVLYKYSFENISGENYVDDVGQTINWMFRSQKLHFNAPNNYKHVKSVSIITSQTEETTMRYKMEFRNYRDLSNIMEVDVFERDVDLLTTIIKKVNFIKTNAFQFSVMNDVKNPLPRKFVTPNIAIKYRITERLR